MPIPFVGLAAISPATNVPCPCSSSVRRAADERLAPRRRGRRDRDATPSMPESMIATLTGARLGIVGQNDHAWSWSRYHSFAASGSVFANAAASRREPTSAASGDEEERASSLHGERLPTRPGGDAVARAQRGRGRCRRASRAGERPGGRAVGRRRVERRPRPSSCSLLQLHRRGRRDAGEASPGRPAASRPPTRAPPPRSSRDPRARHPRRAGTASSTCGLTTSANVPSGVERQRPGVRPGATGRLRLERQHRRTADDAAQRERAAVGRSCARRARAASSAGANHVERRPSAFRTWLPVSVTCVSSADEATTLFTRPERPSRPTRSAIGAGQLQLLRDRLRVVEHGAPVVVGRERVVGVGDGDEVRHVDAGRLERRDGATARGREEAACSRPCRCRGRPALSSRRRRRSPRRTRPAMPPYTWLRASP